ncbi:MAG: translation elongation factor 4 [Candidatus Nealsonbacteria bacterium]
MLNKIRNFCIISHVNHGKSTLADRFLETTGTISMEKMRPQYLNAMDLEREKGITIKMTPVRMKFNDYILNLIDTPGHVDFGYEVSRSLAAVEGAILLVDATKGIQAQTIGNLELAKNQKLVIVPVINKIDSPQAKIEETEKEMMSLLGVDASDIIKISAKDGVNVDKVMEAVLEKVPVPQGDEAKPLKALVFDSKYDAFKGVLAYVRIFDGEVKKGDKIYLMQSKVAGEVKEVGIFNPEFFPAEKLGPGDIGYIATGVKVPGQVRVGETITIFGERPEALIGYQEPNPMVFLSIYPENLDNFELLKDSLERLKLNDAALSFKPDFKEGLGRGFQCGFLGLLHTEIIAERLRREFGLSLILSTPSVIYKITLTGGKEIFVYTSADWPDTAKIVQSQELWIKLQVLTPVDYLGEVLKLLESIESKQLKTSYLSQDKVELLYEVPLREIITKSFYDKLKGASKGFASMNYEILGWRQANLVKLDILILGKRDEAFSRIVPEKDAFAEGRKTVAKLKEVLPSQLFSVPLQAAVGGKVIARETISARRRDVIAPLYGGDYSRKRKLLEKQKKGKKDLKEKGRIKIPSKTFLEVFKI